ncbi:MAG TPA: immunoglobulin domain-containing protein, partial [Methylomirabilota bacterium]|nr:immunoglobulin domain-containing protein [Methylomirabilota bacterium]
MRFRTVFGFLLLAVTTVGAQVIVNYTQPWRYNADGLELGTAWRSPNFDDSHWPTGPGVFATFNEPLLDGATLGTQLFTTVSNRYVTNFYFRTVLPGSQVPSGHVLYATNQIDDGAVVYLNGAEVGRIAMPPGNPTANTLATRLNDVSFHGLEVFRIETTNLLGTNFLCAEVHQGSGVGGDMVWGMKLAAVPAPVRITAQPQPQSSIVGGSVVFAVGVDGGGPIFFQWQKDGATISDATNATLALNSVLPADAGSYSIVVSNALASALSSNAILSVGCAAPVTITHQPTSHVLTAGDTLILNVGASGTAPLAYRWFRNGVPLTAGTNSSYAKTNVHADDSAFYWVSVGNCAGAVLSSRTLVSVADRPYVLIGLTNHVWRYEDSNTDLGTAWRATNYHDGFWKSGLGILGMEENALIAPLIHTFLPLQTPGASANIPTYYFRTAFTLTNEPVSVVLVSSNYIDDGAVVYLNGVEAFRYNMPATVVTFNTLALTANPAGEGLFIVSNLPPGLLVQGTNMLAVEVHQNSLTSADIVFGMEVSVVPLPPTLLQITNQPADIVVEELKVATFSAGVSGSGAQLQWLRNGWPISGATKSSLTKSNVTMADAGWYALRASNAVSVVFTRLARLDVVVDSAAPKLLAGDILDGSTVLLRFSEPITESSATNVVNYFITNTLGGIISVINVTPTNGTNVLLRTSPMLSDRNYIARVNGVRDTSPNTNIIVLNSSVPLARTMTLVPFDAVWDFYDPFALFENPDPGPDWTESTFTRPDNWGTGSGSFLAPWDLSEVPVPVNTQLSLNDTLASYFRNKFTSTASRGGLVLSLRHAIDDGAVFYLNTTEIARFNMPAGPVTHTNSASMATTSFLLRDADEVLSASFHTGSNIFAAELHQVAIDDDKLFGVELTARIESFVLGPIMVTSGPEDRIVVEGQSVEFSATTVGADRFQWQCCGTTMLAATNIPGATNPVYRIERASLSLDGETFRLRVSNSNSSINTTLATLRVFPDTTPPALVAALLSNGVITVTFSEPVTPATATNRLNFAVTNSNGEALIINGATLVNETNVILSFAGSLAGFCVVVVNGVTDTAAVPNSILPGSAVTIGADFFIPMDSAWRYLLINTNEVVQTTFFQPSYDDSFWAGPSNALLYVESASLPGPKNTLLSVADETGVNRINTFYFRKTVVPSISGVPAVLRIRHIIDDGLVLYLNGAEVYRFNIRTGAVTAATQALMSVGDATLQGPFE